MSNFDEEIEEEETEEIEPQEHDEFAAKVYALIQQEVTEKIQSTVEGLEYQTKRNGELQSKIYELQRSIRESERETKKLLREKEQEVRRQLFGGFTIGDKVFYPKAIYNSDPCQSCNEKGKLTVTLGEEKHPVNCPKCQGMGKRSFTTWAPKEDKVRSVHFEMNDRNKWLHFYLEREDCKRDVETIFKTAEECQVYCDEKSKPKPDPVSV